VADEADMAQDNIERDLDINIAARRAVLNGPGSEECIDCEEPIPPARRKAVPNCVRCLDCQEEFEGGK